jgi:large subunit ribosomal protein L25
MERRELEVEFRETRGKGAARKLRRAGKIPGVFYGPDREPVSILLDPKKLQEALGTRSGLNTILELKSSTKELNGCTAMLKDYQEEPLESGFIHADLLAVDLNKPIRVEVPVELHGNPVGVSLGGTLDQMLWEVEVECLPLEVPDRIELNVSHLEIGHSIHVSEIKLADGIELLTDPEIPIATVLVPRLVAEEAAPAEEAEAEEGKAEEAKPGEKPEKPEEKGKSERSAKPEK